MDWHVPIRRILERDSWWLLFQHSSTHTLSVDNFKRFWRKCSEVEIRRIYKQRHWLDRGDGIDLWGHATLAGSGQWDWFTGVCGIGWIRAVGLIYWSLPWGAQHWLDWSDGIDSWGCAKWQSTIWFLKLKDDSVCHVWCWGKCAECIWLRGW